MSSPKPRAQPSPTQPLDTGLWWAHKDHGCGDCSLIITSWLQKWRSQLLCLTQLFSLKLYLHLTSTSTLHQMPRMGNKWLFFKNRTTKVNGKHKHRYYVWTSLYQNLVLTQQILVNTFQHLNAQMPQHLQAFINRVFCSLKELVDVAALCWKLKFILKFNMC